MRRRSYRYLAAIALLPLAAGCVQATRHSNTMVFGTNTSVGVKVGTDPSQVPAVQIGYNRQEAVIMPLLANTTEKEGSQNMLSPCRLATTVKTNGEGGDQEITDNFTVPEVGDAQKSTGVHPCKFVGIRAKNGKLIAQDSYSVLASFGAEISGKAKDPEAAVGIAQYFATGVAAQTLAATGGAAVVSVGKGAEESAKKAAASPSTAAVFGNTEAFNAGLENLKNYDNFRLAFAGKISDTDDDKVMERIQAYDKGVPDLIKFSTNPNCKNKETCLSEISKDNSTVYKTSFSISGNEKIYTNRLDTWDNN